MKIQYMFAFLLSMVLVGMLFSTVVVADPSGTDVGVVNVSSGTDSSGGQATAQAGNVTQLSFNQTKITDVWQGYYGNISGELLLVDGADNKFYDWTPASTTGEVFASRSQVSDWSTVLCGNQGLIGSEETALSITTDWTDSINNTMDGSSHDSFTVGTEGPFTTCPSTQALNSTGGDSFWNVLLNVSNTAVYTALIDDNGDGFNGNTWDFELLVPVDYGSTSTYYFYAELV